MKDPLLLDTCLLIWIATQSPSALKAKAVLQDAEDAKLPVYISPFSAWELGMLVAKGRLTSQLSLRVIFARLLALPGVALAGLSPDVLISANNLPFDVHPDPADRIIIATAREYGMRIVTRDRKILDYAAQGHVMALEC